MPVSTVTAMVENEGGDKRKCIDDVEPVMGAHLKYGEMEFQEVEHDGKLKTSGHRANFCIVNKNEQDANSVLRFMFSWEQGWRMTPPNSFLECTSNLGESKRSAAWFEDFFEEIETAAKATDSLMTLAAFNKLGLKPTDGCPGCKAMTDESGVSPDPGLEPPQHTKACSDAFKRKQEEIKRRDEASGKNNPLVDKVLKTLNTEDKREVPDLYQVCLVETMKGLAATMHERKAWVDFGNGSVDGLKELMGVAFSQYWNDGIGAAASNKTPVVFAVRMVGEDKLFGDEVQYKLIEEATLGFTDEKKPQQVATPADKQETDPAVPPTGDEGKKDEGNKDEGNKDEGNKDEGNKDEGNKDEGNKDEGNKDEGNKDEAKKDEYKKDEGKKEKADPNAKPKLTKRVLYQFDARDPQEETFNLTLEQSFISDVVTHVVFVHSFQVRDDLRTKLRGMGQRIALVANGDSQGSTSLYRRILSDSKFGSQYIVFDNTGGAAQRVCNDLKKQRKTRDTGYPDAVPANQFKVIDPLKPLDNSRKTLANVLFAIQETEETESGSVQAERKRLQYAWEQHAVFHLNSQHYHALARALQFAVVLLAFLTTASAVISQQCGAKWEELTEKQFGPDFQGWNGTVPGFLDKLCGFAPWRGGIITPKAVIADAYGKMFQTATILLPLFGSVVLSVINKTNPLLKWAHLKSGSVSMMCEIYLYRTRVTRYSRAAVTKDIDDKVEELCQQTGAGGGGVGKRSIFATECQRIINDTLGSDMMYDYLDDPGTEAKKASVTLFDSDALSSKGTSCFQRVCCCQRKAKNNSGKGGRGDSPNCFASLCGSGKKGKKSGTLLPAGGGFGEDEEEEYDDANTDLWEASGHDFQFNPSVMDGEVVRDDGCTLLNGEEYTHVRMFPLLQEYHRRAKVVGRAVKTLQMTIMLTTGLTTLVAAMPHYDLRPCVPVMVAFVALLSTSLEFENYQARLTNLQKSLEILKGLQVWWQSLSASERRLRANKERLVSTTEEQADAEISPWKKSSKSASGADQEDEGDKKK